MANTYYRGQGKVWIATRDSTGRTSGFAELGDAEALSITPSESFDDVYESQSGLRQQVVHSSTQLGMSGEMTVLNFNGANLAKALIGTEASVAAGSVTNEVHKAYKGGSVFLKYPGVSAVTVTNVAASTTYVASTDYIVDAANGRIDFPTGSSIVDGADLHVDYTHGGADSVAEAFVTGAKREYIVIFEGKNMNQQGTPVIVRLHRVYMNAATSLALLGTATQRFPMGFTLLPAEEITTGSKFMSVTIKDQN